MPAADTDVLTVIKVWPKDSADAEQLQLFANVAGWGTVSTDTPASTPAKTTFAPSSLKMISVGRSQQEDGLRLLSGVVRYGTEEIVLNNDRSEVDFTAPLDDIEDYAWDGARAEIWSAQAQIVNGVMTTRKIPLANLTQRETLVVERFSAGTPHATLRLRSLDKWDRPATPARLNGWGTIAGFDAGAGTVADEPAIRGTGDFTIRWIAAPGNASGTINDIQIIRLTVTGTFPNTVFVVDVRNAAGTWQSFSSVGLGVALSDVTVTFNSSTNKAILYLNGANNQELTITGGLWASSSASSWTFASGAWSCGGWAFYDVVKSADWIDKNYYRGVQDDDDLVLGFPFDEGIGPVIEAVDGGSSTIREGTLAYTGGWGPSGTGDAGLAGFRPAAIVGIAFQVPALPFHFISSRYIFGFAGGGVGGVVHALRHVTEDGERLPFSDVDNVAATRDFNVTSNTVTNTHARDLTVVNRREWCEGQTLSRSPAGGAGNPGTMTVAKVMVPPRTGDSLVPARIRVAETLAAEPGVSVTLTQTLAASATLDHYQPSLGGNSYQGFRDDIGLSSSAKIGGSFAKVDAHTQKTVAAWFLSQSEVETTPSESHEGTDETWMHGWYGPGDAPARDFLNALAHSYLSVDNAGAFIGQEPDGTAEVYGVRLDADADDLTIHTTQVADIVGIPESIRRPTNIRLRYSRCWQTVEPADSLSQTDLLLHACHVEWLTESAGSGTTEGILETSLMFGPDARRRAAACERVQKGRLDRVVLTTPVADSLIKSCRVGRQCTITWTKSARWASGKVCLVVGVTAGVDSLEFEVWSES